MAKKNCDLITMTKSRVTFYGDLKRMDEERQLFSYFDKNPITWIKEADLEEIKIIIIIIIIINFFCKPLLGGGGVS